MRACRTRTPCSRCKMRQKRVSSAREVLCIASIAANVLTILRQILRYYAANVLSCYLPFLTLLWLGPTCTRRIRFARRRQTSVDLAGSLSRNLARCRAFETFTPLAAEAFAMSGVDFAASRRASRRTGADAKLRARRGAHAAARAGAVGKRCTSEKTNRLDGDDGIGRRATAAHRATAVRAATRDGDASARTSDTIIARARWVLADAW